MSEPATLAEWLAGRPVIVQELAAKFPLGSIFGGADNETLFLLGYDEGGLLIVSKTDPGKDYERAVATKQYIHPGCARIGDIPIRPPRSIW